MWLLGSLGFCGSLLAFILSFIPPSQIATGSSTVWFSVLAIGCIVVVAAPYIIFAMRKPSWRDPMSDFAPFSWEPAARGGSPDMQQVPQSPRDDQTQQAPQRPCPPEAPQNPQNPQAPQRPAGSVRQNGESDTPQGKSRSASQNTSGRKKP